MKWFVAGDGWSIRHKTRSSDMKPGSSPLFAMSITPKNIPVHLPLTVSLDGHKIEQGGIGPYKQTGEPVVAVF
jgi:hypothetical protein